MNNDLMFSSESEEWATPQELFDKLNAEFNFSLDVCATAENRKCNAFFSKDQNALTKEWAGVCWMNPPYGRKIGEWVKKAFNTSVAGGGTIVCLLPARTDTRWWHNYCIRGEVRFIRGRLKFGEQKNSAPFPSAIVIFRKII